MTDELRSFDVYFNARQIGANKIKNNRKLGAQGAVTAKPADEKRILSALYRFKFEPFI
nr:hypothetical protein [uncultured Campylobacter sp.]